MSQQRITEYLMKRRRMLDLITQMWADPLVQCYNDIEKPSRDEELRLGSIFLAGPTSRKQITEYNWRCEAVAYLREAGFTGYIYIPEPRGREDALDFTERGYIHKWESSRLLNATLQLYWVPRNSGELFGLNTNFEWGLTTGQLLSEGRDPRSVFIGWPPEAERMGLPNHYACDLAFCKRHFTLINLCYAVVGKTPPVPADDDVDDIPF